MWKPVWAWYYRVHLQSVRVKPVPASTSTACRGEESLHCHVNIASVLHINLKLAKFFRSHLLVWELSIFRRPLSFFSSLCTKHDSHELYSLFPHSTIPSQNSFFPFKCISIWCVKSNAIPEASWVQNLYQVTFSHVILCTQLTAWVCVLVAFLEKEQNLK